MDHFSCAIWLWSYKLFFELKLSFESHRSQKYFPPTLWIVFLCWLRTSSAMAADKALVWNLHFCVRVFKVLRFEYSPQTSTTDPLCLVWSWICNSLNRFALKSQSLHSYFILSCMLCLCFRRWPGLKLEKSHRSHKSLVLSCNWLIWFFIFSYTWCLNLHLSQL